LAPAPEIHIAITYGAVAKPRVTRRQATILVVSEHPSSAAVLPQPGSPFGMRAAGLKPGMRSTGESFRIPMQRSVVSLKWKCPHSPYPHRRLTEPRSGPFEAVRYPIWDRFRDPTLIGLLRHSKRFFGLLIPRWNLLRIVTNAL
jgi:hypothetical protein